MTTLNLNDLTVIADEVDEKLYGKKSNETLFKHLLEEIDELLKELNRVGPDAKFEQLKEFGDVLFCIVSIARQNELDMAHGLSLTITKLQERIKFNIRE